MLVGRACCAAVRCSRHSWCQASQHCQGLRTAARFSCDSMLHQVVCMTSCWRDIWLLRRAVVSSCAAHRLKIALLRPSHVPASCYEMGNFCSRCQRCARQRCITEVPLSDGHDLEDIRNLLPGLAGTVPRVPAAPGAAAAAAAPAAAGQGSRQPCTGSLRPAGRAAARAAAPAQRLAAGGHRGRALRAAAVHAHPGMLRTPPGFLIRDVRDWGFRDAYKPICLCVADRGST